MKEYQGFPISNFRSGFDEALEPWLLPRDAFQSLINAHLYRGVVERIEGYNLFAPFTYRNILSLGTPDGVTTVFSGTLPSVPISSNIVVYGTLVTGSTAQIMTYFSDDGTIVRLQASGGGYATIAVNGSSAGQYTVTFFVAPPSNTYSSIFIQWDSATGQTPGDGTAIMGIKPYYAQNGSQEVLVFNQTRVGTIIEDDGVLASTIGTDYVVEEIPHAYYQSDVITGNGSIKTFTGTVQAPFVPGTLTFMQFLSNGEPVTTTVNLLPVPQNVVDNGFGALQASPQSTLVVSGQVNYVTGAFTITFGTAPPSGNYFDSTVGIYGDLFTGDISNFFSLINFQDKAFFCNNVNPIFFYDSHLIQYLNTNQAYVNVESSMGVPQYDISKCLHLTADRDRLILFSPTVKGILENGAAFTSAQLNPFDWINSDEFYASTSQPIRTFSFINSDIVVRFSNSERVFRYTGDTNNPFRWDKTNNVWQCDAPYCAVNYDTYYATVGKPGIVGSNGVNVKRIDEIIPDFTDPYRLVQDLPVPFMNQTSISQCYGERFDDIKEGWICYNSAPSSEGMETASDNVLAYNYLDETYAIYEFPFSCLGLGTILEVGTWGNTYTQWGQANIAWGSYQLGNQSLIDLAGDQFNNVYELNTGNTLTVAGDTTCTPQPVLMSAITKNFNPFIEQGQLCRFGYLDLLVSANQLSILRVQFYLNDELYLDPDGEPDGFYQETILTFQPKDAMSPTNNQTKVWKRIYVGATGKSHTIRFYQNAADFTSETYDQPIYIHAIVPYFKPAGRIFN